jgi:type III pantothenate kinase
MAQTCRTLGIDIGNSGLRIAELDAAHDSIRQTRRISWLHPNSSGSLAAPPPTSGVVEGGSESRYLPDSNDWLGTIDAFLTALEPTSKFHWLVSSVRRDAFCRLEQFVASRPNDRWHKVTRHDLTLSVDVLQPDRVGIDRLLAAAAAARLFSTRPLIVMQAGSALTVDLIRESNVFSGGAILPGVPMMLRLLGQAADMLPQIDADEITELPPLPGRNTEQAMRCGTASALVGGAQHLVERYRQQFGAETLIVLSGGDGMRLAQHLQAPLQIVPNLVLQGLIPIAAKLAK